jgi:hypothetical protein
VDSSKEAPCLQATLAEPIAAAEVVGPALLAGAGRQMRIVLDALGAVVAARMAGDLGGAVEQADLMLGGDEGERPAHEGVRDRVVVAVEADVARKIHEK